MLYLILFFCGILFTMAVVSIWMHEKSYDIPKIPTTLSEEKVDQLKYRIYKAQQRLQQNK